MSKITDTDFHLPIIIPVVFHEQLINSANKPIIVTGIDQSNGEKNEFVVKLRAAERMSEVAFMRELLASFIAIQMGIPVVKPAIVDISTDFVDILKGNPCWQVADKSIGYNYGSLYIVDFYTLVLNQKLNANQLAVAQTIFALDLFIHNMDRTVTKPNMLTNGNEIFILDHEIAFGFVFDLIANDRPGVFRECDNYWISNHCLLPLIKSKSFDYNSFGNKLDCLDTCFWNKSWDLIPKAWQDKAQFDKIKDYLVRIINNKDEFLTEIKKIMS
ncbi:hypothetical protein SAMN05428949_1830 [Chitinophaga sp. YR627]|uniref:HipA family kinase n=1 Tax=Chitinophaga sp. YR627 TaxID=1881041 RepID=UPI0008E33FE1|nr:HipA family kinase [Chitinophaga sp. YR627]SFN18760.1 hypothetical protein SAMN05428949_1830 [Chitinophaga sp. YR627]